MLVCGTALVIFLKVEAMVVYKKKEKSVKLYVSRIMLFRVLSQKIPPKMSQTLLRARSFNSELAKISEF